MRVNSNRPELWKDDIQKSIDFYNDWFLRFAPKTFREERRLAVEKVHNVIHVTNELSDCSSTAIFQNPHILPVLRMCTAPPLARDRLVGLSGVRKHLVTKIERENAIPKSRDYNEILEELDSISTVLRSMLDRDLFVWIEEERSADEVELHRAETVVADRLTGAVSNPIIRNAQERRQLATIADFLRELGYRELKESERRDWQNLPEGTYAFRMNIPAVNRNGRQVNIPVDVIVQRMKERKPLLIEAKSAGDFTNTNKRRKEEAQKFNQLRETFGDVHYILFLCRYFDSGYLGYEAGTHMGTAKLHTTREVAIHST